jgi:hypothetical protein
MLECECQVLYDERELRKDALMRKFGVDFDSGMLSWWIETGTAEPFSGTLRNGIWNFEVR